MHTQLLQGKEVKHDTLLEPGRLLSVAYQPRGQAQPATASVSMLVQPTQAASLRCGVYTAEGSGVGSACLEGSADFSRHSGVDLELEVEQGSAWRGEASITHRCSAAQAKSVAYSGGPVGLACQRLPKLRNLCIPQLGYLGCSWR